MPKPDEILLTYPAERIKALRTFTTADDANIEDELTAALEKLYQKRVPPPVRLYLGDDPDTPKRARKSSAKAGASADNSDAI